MQCHRIEELLELLQPAWIKEQDLSLVQFVAKLAEEAGFEGPLSELTDDMLTTALRPQPLLSCGPASAPSAR